MMTSQTCSSHLRSTWDPYLQACCLGRSDFLADHIHFTRSCDNIDMLIFWNILTCAWCPSLHSCLYRLIGNRPVTWKLWWNWSVTWKSWLSVPNFFAGVEFNCGLRLHGDHPLDVKIYDTRLPTMPETHPSVLWSCCCFQSSADTRRLSIKQPMSSLLLSCTIVERRRGAAS